MIVKRNGFKKIKVIKGKHKGQKGVADVDKKWQYQNVRLDGIKKNFKFHLTWLEPVK